MCYGKSDVGLNASAQAGAEAIAASLDRLNVTPQAIHASPLTRCASVARALAVRLGHDEDSVQIDARLAELDFGDWEMRRWDDLPSAQIDAWARDVEHGRPHGGESVAMLAQRTASWLAEVVERAALLDHAGTARDAARSHRKAGDLVVITHAGTARVMAAQALSLPTLTCIDWPLQMGHLCRLVRRYTLDADTGSRSGARWALGHWNS